MSTAAKILWIAITCLVILFLSLSSYHSTDSTEVGVRTIKWLGKKGVENQIYQPGSAYFFLPIFNAWDTFDTRMQVVEMKGRANSHSRLATEMTCSWTSLFP